MCSDLRGKKASEVNSSTYTGELQPNPALQKQAPTFWPQPIPHVLCHAQTLTNFILTKILQSRRPILIFADGETEVLREAVVEHTLD